MNLFFKFEVDFSSSPMKYLYQCDYFLVILLDIHVN